MPPIDRNNADAIETRAKFRYDMDPVFKATVDLAVKLSIPTTLNVNVALRIALEEQAIASASIALVLHDET